MKGKHLDARFAQCRALAACSECAVAASRQGAVIVDPTRNVVLMDGYTGGPRGSRHGSLCGGFFCLRRGADPAEVEVVGVATKAHKPGEFPIHWNVLHQGVVVRGYLPTKEVAQEAKTDYLRCLILPKTEGTHLEIGCHHAEMNAICNAAARGAALNGAWLLTTAVPCLLCAKLVHHAGIAKVIIDTEPDGLAEGVRYLEGAGVQVSFYGAEEAES